MNIRTKLVTLICLLLSTSLFAQNTENQKIESTKTELKMYEQDYKNEINTQFDNYLDLLTNLKFDESMEYVYPKVFEIFPKEKLAEAMREAFESPEMDISLTEMNIGKINDYEKIDSSYFALFSYSNFMNIKFLDLGDEETKETVINLSKVSFAKTFGEENVEYNEETEYFRIYTEKKVYAISENGKTDWKFLVMDESQKAMLKKLLPKSLVDNL